MARMPHVAAIDQGTTSSRCIVFDADGGIVSVARREHRQRYPQPGWVEHDAAEIWADVRAVVDEAVAGYDIAALGITNQRETTVVWDRVTGEPVHHAIVWQDTRTEPILRTLADRADEIRRITGLPLATYFAGPKVRWLLDHVDGLRDRAERGDVLFGTIDSWLIWNLTGRHVTDVTNASRTLLMDLRTLDWSPDLLDAMGVPRAMLPEIRPSAEVYGTARGGLVDGVPVAGALGDQQAALFGQACFQPGEGKCTYGTGSFLLVNTGATPVVSRHGLLTTVGYQVGSGAPAYALEGAIAVTGALVQWLRDNLGLIGSADEIEALAASVDDNGGCYIVPAFSGLFAPHWRGDARGVIAGLTGYITRAHVARAALEASAWQTREVVDAMNADTDVALRRLRVDGGMTVNDLLMQTLSDVLDLPVVRPRVTETTCLGAAYAAGLAVGFWPDLDALRAHWQADRDWQPLVDKARREREWAQWRKAVSRTLDWV
ncbi:glycerol kinase GlpK [Asanoa iriomotensis]|uniref:Glycerol kinase n=2 Tax=Asanoa iriomotensis TaxID=234613 RepID=A0ABQ4BZH1_9ACTN|nr:glycerol kinase [Asanoa iriomotensis]